MPRRFWALYNESSIALAKRQTIGTNISVIAFEGNSFLGATNFTQGNGGPTYHEGPQTPLPEDVQRSARHGYYASVSFMDFCVGRVLDELQALGLDQTTAVLFHADHGWKG